MYRLTHTVCCGKRRRRYVLQLIRRCPAVDTVTYTVEQTHNVVKQIHKHTNAQIHKHTRLCHISHSRLIAHHFTAPPGPALYVVKYSEDRITTLNSLLWKIKQGAYPVKHFTMGVGPAIATAYATAHYIVAYFIL